MNRTRIKNLHFDSVRRIIIPERLWTAPFATAFAFCAATVFAFDILWCLSTTFRPMSMISTYFFGVTLALLMAMPAALTRRVWLQVIVLLVADGVCMANLMYSRTYFTPIPPSSYLLAGNMGQYSDSATASFAWLDLLLPVITLAGWAVMLKAQKRQKRREARYAHRETPSRVAPYFITLGVMSLICWIIGLCHKGGMTRHIAWMKDHYSLRTSYPVAYTLPCAFIADLHASIQKPTGADMAMARRWLADREKYNRDFFAWRTDSLTRQNLVIILVESLEGWTLGKSVEGQEITPNLNRYLADSTTWMHPSFHSQVGDGRSIDGHLITLSGILPRTPKVYSSDYAANDFPSLVKEMKRANGATSYIFSGAKPVMWNQKQVAQSMGFEHMLYRDEWDASEHFGHNTSPSDETFIDQLLARLIKGEVWPQGEKAVVEVATISSHFPFIIPEEKRHITLRESYPEYLAEYITSVNYTDHAVGRLLDYLKTRSDWPQTMVVVTGDHEGLASYRADMRAYSPKMAELVDPVGNVPLMVVNAPDVSRATGQRQQADIYPTIISMLGIKPVWNGVGFTAIDGDSPVWEVNARNHNLELPDTVKPEIKNLLQDQGKASGIIIRADMLKGIYTSKK